MASTFLPCPAGHCVSCKRGSMYRVGTGGPSPRVRRGLGNELRHARWLLSWEGGSSGAGGSLPPVSLSPRRGGTRCSRHLFLTGCEQMMVWMDIGKDLGFETTLCLGAKKGGDTFEGHQWQRIPRMRRWYSGGLHLGRAPQLSSQGPYCSQAGWHTPSPGCVFTSSCPIFPSSLEAPLR